jgi:hypothetical protein
VLRALLSRGWNGGSQGLFVCSFRKEECCSMRIHLDKKPSDGVAIAFVVITLLTPVTLANPAQPPARCFLKLMPWRSKNRQLAR